MIAVVSTQDSKFSQQCCSRRLEWKVPRAAANALRLHVAALPALAVALLLIRLASTLILWQRHSQHHASLKQFSSSKATAGSKLQRRFQAPEDCLQQARCHIQTLRWQWLLGCSLLWGVTASGLWPQLALWAGWMSHRRPTLPSVIGSAFLILVAEGLLEALELVCSLVGTADSLLRRNVQYLSRRSGPSSCDEPQTAVKPAHISSRYSVVMCIVYLVARISKCKLISLSETRNFKRRAASRHLLWVS